jgi:hypothetical protein
VIIEIAARIRLIEKLIVAHLVKIISIFYGTRIFIDVFTSLMRRSPFTPLPQEDSWFSFLLDVEPTPRAYCCWKVR